MGRAGEAQQHLDLIPSTIDPPHTALLLANYSEDPAAAGLAALSWARWLTGDDTAAQQASRQSLQRAASINHPFTQAYAHVMAAILAQLRGDPVAAEHHATLGIEISQQHAIPFFEAVAMTPLGWARARIGDPHGGSTSSVTDWQQPPRRAPACTDHSHSPPSVSCSSPTATSTPPSPPSTTRWPPPTLPAKPSTPRRSNDCAATRTVKQATSPRRWRPPNSHSNAADALGVAQFAHRATRALATMRNESQSPSHRFRVERHRHRRKKGIGAAGATAQPATPPTTPLQAQHGERRTPVDLLTRGQRGCDR